MEERFQIMTKLHVSFKKISIEELFIWIILLLQPVTYLSNGSFSFTLSDIFLILYVLFFLKTLKFKNNIFTPILRALCLLLVVFTLSILFNGNLYKNFSNIMPVFYGIVFLIMLSIASFRIGTKKLVRLILYSISINFIASFLLLFCSRLLLQTPQTIFLSQRYQYFTVNPNQLVVYLSIGMLIIILSALFFKIAINWASFLLLIGSFCLLNTGSKGAIISIFLSFLGYLCIFKSKIFTKKFIVYFIFLILSLFYFTQNNTNIDRISALAHDNAEIDQSSAERIFQIKEGIFFFFQYPLLGIGIGNFPIRSNSHYEIHNTYAALAAETGLLGLCSALILFFSYHNIIYKSFQNNRLFLTSIFFTSFCYATFNMYYVCVRERWNWLFLGFVLLLCQNFIKNTQYNLYAK